MQITQLVSLGFNDPLNKRDKTLFEINLYTSSKDFYQKEHKRSSLVDNQ